LGGKKSPPPGVVKNQEKGKEKKKKKSSKKKKKTPNQKTRISPEKQGPNVKKIRKDLVSPHTRQNPRTPPVQKGLVGGKRPGRKKKKKISFQRGGGV